jgi:hypothetical protein
LNCLFNKHLILVNPPIWWLDPVDKEAQVIDDGKDSPFY